MDAARLAAASARGITLLTLFDVIVRTKSHDPRDKIFGILALLPEVEQRMISVSYGKTSAQVYTEATAALISSYGVLDLLAFVFLDGADGRCSSSPNHSCRLAELPSWALDFTCIEDGSNSGPVNIGIPISEVLPGNLIDASTLDYYGRRIDGDVSLDAATAICGSPSICYQAFKDCVKPGCFRREYIRGLDNGLLHLGGLVIDHIVKILRLPKMFWWRGGKRNGRKGKHAQHALLTTDLREFLCTLPMSRPYNHLANQCSWLMDDPNKDTIRWRDVVDQIPSPLPEAGRSIDILWLTFAIWKVMAGHTMLPRVAFSSDREDVYGTKTMFERYFDIATKRLMLFVTSSGFLGLALDRVEEGDVIVLVHGCESPIVLRQVAEDRYTFQGLAFLNGIMEGELAGMITDDHIEHESFVVK